MKKAILLIFILIDSILYLNGQSYQATIRKGTTTNSYKIFIKSNADAAGATFSSIIFNIQIPNSILISGLPPSATLNTPALNALFSSGTFAQLPVENIENYHNYTFYVAGAQSVARNIIANTEFEVAEISFSGGVSNLRVAATDVRLASLGGNDTNYFYLETGGSGVSLVNSSPYYGTGAVNDATGATTSYVSALTTALPLDLLTFQAKMAQGKAQLDWSTANEVNVDRYLVQKSINGESFEQIGEVAATANDLGKEITKYQYNTPQKEEIAYYRLKMLDRDGSYKFSNMVALENEAAKENLLALAPNPMTNDQINVQYTAKEAGQYQLTVVSATGENLFKQTVSANAGSNSFQIKNLSHLPRGQYYVQLQGQNNSVNLSKRLMK